MWKLHILTEASYSRSTMQMPCIYHVARDICYAAQPLPSCLSTSKQGISNASVKASLSMCNMLSDVLMWRRWRSWERQLRTALCWVVFFVMIAFYLPVVAAVQALLQVSAASQDIHLLRQWLPLRSSCSAPAEAKAARA